MPRINQSFETQIQNEHGKIVSKRTIDYAVASFGITAA